MEHRKINRIIGISLFVISLVTYVATLPPTVVFWDVGEFIAAAYLLQVPHPPGAPLFLLIGRIFTMIPFASDIAVRAHFISALSSALTIMFLYLVTVRFIMMFRGKPETTNDKLLLYGSSIIGALSLAFSKTFWFNAVEAEVYGVSMLFVSVILWLALRWYERADWERSDVYLLLIAYLVGLSVGVHLLALLTLFSVMLLVYFRRYEVTFESLIKFGVVAVLIFFVIYPGIVKELPSLLDGEFGGTRSQIVAFIPIAALLGAIYGVYRSIREHNRTLNVALLSFLLIVVGYSTYAVVYIRANANPPMNENDPSNLARLVSYLNREQYGQAPVLQRRYGAEPEQRAAHAKYTSDMDFMLRYQINHMYIRYWLWNYVGTEGDFKDAGVNPKQLYAIPFILGIVGAYYHWRRSPKMAVVAIVSFIIMGVILALYQNQQEPQPRERDYFYVGSFFIFSLWIAMGVLSVIDAFRAKLSLKGEGGTRAAIVGLLALAFVFVPGNMLRTNYHEADRSGNYVAWDYSYNLLQSCDQDAILFTNGDNDTFPLWYLQDVEGVRRDVRIVNLSLLNTNWYIKQLKHGEPHGAKKVPISISDLDIERLGPIPWEPRTLELPVPDDVWQRYSAEGTARTLKDTSQKKIAFFMAHTFEAGNIKALRVQDILVYDIVRTSNWQRPIYFAMTVSDDGKIGLRDYLRMEGLALRLTPRKEQMLWANIDEERMTKNLFTDTETPSRDPQLGFLWRGLGDSTVYFDEDVRRLMSNYRHAFLILGAYYANMKNQPSMMVRALDRMEEVIPRRVIPMETRLKFDVGNYYRAAEAKEKGKIYLTEVTEELKPVVDARIMEPLSETNVQYNSYFMLLTAYQNLEMYDEALELLDVIQSMYGHVPGLSEFVGERRKEFQARKLMGQGGDTSAALRGTQRASGTQSQPRR
ncbi:MAG TPA: DUF2723 domain-containing protein [Bacteroidota bacterium]|nr:DUF2723 domain-containing protein [Bacteroidota bacterium]